MKKDNTKRRPWGNALLLACCISVARGYTSKKPPFLTSQDMCGIWKLQLGNKAENLPLPTSPGSAVSNIKRNENVESEGDEIVVRLNEDGTFDPYTSTAPPLLVEDAMSLSDLEFQNLQNVIERGGCWEYTSSDKCLVLAANRPGNASPGKVDTLLMGKLMVDVTECLMEDATTTPLDEEKILPPEDDSAVRNTEENFIDNDITADIDVHLSIPQGQIQNGKFFYSKKHTAFFDQPMLFEPSNTGMFCMNQLLGNLNTRLKTERDASKAAKLEVKYHKRDFHNRTFYLTATPHPVDKGYAAQDLYYDESKATLDITIMPIHFYANNTFAAIGTEKILRGRYGIAGKERDRLWVQVSLFGAGRSTPGSVYSEGKLLSQEDRRGFSGSIQAYPNKNNQTIYFVDGEYFYGTDFKEERKPNSMGTFTLLEVDGEKGKEDDDENVNDWDSEDEIGFGWDDGESAFQ